MGFAFGVLIFVSFLLLASADQENKNAAWVVHTRDVLNKIDELVAALSDAENGRRGYVLSGQQRYRSHFTNQVEHAYRSLEQLRKLTQDNPPQTAACESLEPLIRQRLTISTNSVQAREANGLDAPSQTSFMEQGQLAMESVRQLAGQMAGRESALLKERLEVQDKNIKGTEGFAVLLGLCGMGVFISFFVLFWKSDARRRQAEANLEHTNQELEQRVTARTAELSQSEKRVAQERNLLRTVIDNLPDCIYLKDAAGRYAVNNLANVRALNAVSEAETLNKTVFDFFPEETAKLHALDDGQVLSTGEPLINRELQARNLAGDSRWLLSTKVPLRDSHGSISGLLGIHQDITERKGAEKKLHTQLACLALLSHTTRAIAERQDLASIFQVVLRSLEDNLPIDFGCICVYEPTAPRLSVAKVGTRSEALAQELSLGENSHIEIDQNGIARCVHGELVYEPDISRIDFPFPRRLAAGGLASLVIAPLLVESQVFGVLIAARRQPSAFSSSDCEFLRQLSEHVALASHQAELYTALQVAYNDLRKTQQAAAQQERLRALGQMASGIAHDINNAISPAAIYSEFLLENEPTLTPRAKEHLQIISSAIEDVAATVVRMREFYRQREPQLTLAPLQLNELVEQVLNLTRARWSDMPQQRGTVIQIQIELAKDLPTIIGVESEIRDALTNLILNAVDAMPDGGTLTLRTQVQGASAFGGGAGAEAHSVCVEVIDSGIGMTEETQRRCLEPFFTTKGERGTGLGLAMVYGMAQRHGAEIEIESELGKGTTMRVRFVSHPLDTKGRISSESVRSVPVRLRILVVDDDPMLLKSLCDALEGDGHVVVTAGGGQAGIDAFAARFKSDDPFNVVITDLGMPYIDGRRVAATIKGIYSAAPIILLTGWGHRLMAEGDVPENVDRVLSKPPKLAELRAALAHCAQLRPPES